jgi:maltodextrin utilization protein YvdJ
VIRLSIFVVGLGLLLVGAANRYAWFAMPIDPRSITLSLGFVSITLDVIMMVAGVFFILIAWVFHKLNAVD